LAVKKPAERERGIRRFEVRAWRGRYTPDGVGPGGNNFTCERKTKREDGVFWCNSGIRRKVKESAYQKLQKDLVNTEELRRV